MALPEQIPYKGGQGLRELEAGAISLIEARLRVGV